MSLFSIALGTSSIVQGASACVPYILVTCGFSFVTGGFLLFDPLDLSADLQMGVDSALKYELDDKGWQEFMNRKAVRGGEHALTSPRSPQGFPDDTLTPQ